MCGRSCGHAVRGGSARVSLCAAHGAIIWSFAVQPLMCTVQDHTGSHRDPERRLQLHEKLYISTSGSCFRALSPIFQCCLWRPLPLPLPLLQLLLMLHTRDIPHVLPADCCSGSARLYTSDDRSGAGMVSPSASRPMAAKLRLRDASAAALRATTPIWGSLKSSSASEAALRASRYAWCSCKVQQQHDHHVTK